MAHQEEGERGPYQLEAHLRRPLDSSATFSATSYAFEDAAQINTLDEYQLFQISLCLCNFVNELARQVKHGHADRNTLSTLLNAEYTLFAVNASRELPLNPFLSHWTDSIASWETSLGRLSSDGGRGNASQRSVDERRIVLIARLELLKRLLMEPFPPASLHDATPESFVAALEEAHAYAKFDVKVWLEVAIGTDSLIWNDNDAMSTFRSSIAAIHPAEQAIAQPLNLADLQDRSKDEVARFLERSPEMVRSALLQMPADNIKALELFNGLLSMDIDAALHRAGTHRAQLIRDFIQHALRNLESLSDAIQEATRPASASSEAEHNPEPSSAQSRSAGTAAASSAQAPAADLRERQIRAARLTALFVKNLFGKGYATASDINGELVELVTRYSWVKEVKELPFA